MVSVSLTETAFCSAINRYTITLPTVSADVLLFLRTAKSHVIQILTNELIQKGQIKFWLSLRVMYEPSAQVEGSVAQQPDPSHFNSKSGSGICLSAADIHECISNAFDQIFHHSETHEQKGSGLVVQSVDRLYVNVVRYKPLRGSTYTKLPQSIENKHAVVNVQNLTDEKCFIWSILAAKHRMKNAERVHQYKPFESELNMDGISFPVAVNQIQKFERQNTVSVNVYGYEEGTFFPLYHSKTANGMGEVLLLLYSGHYCLIRNLNRLLGSERKHKACCWFCPKCLFPLYAKDRYEKHVIDCKNDQLCQVSLPSGDAAVLKFRNHRRTLRIPVVVYADIETFLRMIAHCLPSNGQSYTVKYQQHEPYSYGVVVAKSCCSNRSKIDGLKIYRGVDPINDFLSTLVEIAHEYHAELQRHPLRLSEEEEISFQAATHCHYCNDPLVPGDAKRDHCHYCGRFRGAAHNQCNQALQLNKNITCVMHNLRRYDAHLVMREIGKFCRENDFTLNCVARGEQDYITFSMRKSGWEIRFVDSCQFLGASLAHLVSIQPRDAFHAMRQYFPDDNIFSLLLRKGVLPYDSITCWEDLKAKDLPKDKDKFYNLLTEEAISEEDFNHAHTVKRVLNLPDVGEYTDTYLTCDVLQTCDVCEDLRSFGMETYNLDPFHYVTMPSFSFDAALKMTNVKLGLLTCPIMYNFIERGIRGGISTITHRYARSNNRYTDGYNDKEPDSYLIYWDVNNLYGNEMCRALPTGEFEWLDDVDTFDVMKIDSDGDFGYILEVDLHYPQEYHDEHNDLPLAPEKITIQESMLSPYAQAVMEELEMKWKPSEKLAPNFFDKHNYIVHIAALQFYVKHGLVITKIHRVMKFRQDAWLKPYVLLNTEMRKQATNKLKKDLFKLCVNSVYGKSMENIWLYLKLELVTTEARLQKVVNKPTFQKATIFDESLVACSLQPTKVVLNKPIYTGLSVLDFAKLHMYNLHYEFVRPKYGDKSKLLLTDTDSLIYHIRTPNIYKDMYETKTLFDFSDYPRDHPLYSEVNKKVLGKLKDENAGVPMRQFTGLRAKMYSFQTQDGAECKRAKGIKKVVVKKRLRYKDYLQALRKPKVRFDHMRMIRSFNHKLYSILVNKRSLSAFDDKRFILDNGISTLAHGHYETLK